MEALLDTIASQPLALVVFAAVLALIFAVRYLGLWQGENASPKAPVGAAQVAAVIVDPTALNAAAGEVSGLAVAVHELTAVVKVAGEHHRRTAEELDAIREELRIHRELSRR
jgi:hypothetical protein